MAHEKFSKPLRPESTGSATERYIDVLQFYNDEATLLDCQREDEWLALLADDFRYRIPVRTTRTRDAGWNGQFSTTAFHMDDNKAAIAMRVKRLQTGLAFAEDPPSRTRHFVSNLRITPGAVAGEYETRVNLLLTRGNPDQSTVQVLSAERIDVLRETATGWQIVERTVQMDHTVVPTNNLAVIF